MENHGHGHAEWSLLTTFYVSDHKDRVIHRKAVAVAWAASVKQDFGKAFHEEQAEVSAQHAESLR